MSDTIILKDTVYHVVNDAITNTKHIYHETIKIVEPDNISTWVSIGIALFAVLATIFYSRRNSLFNNKVLEKTAEHNRLSVRPILSFLWSDQLKGNGSYIVNLINSGVGPAIIKSIVYKYRDGENINLNQLLFEQEKEFYKKYVSNESNYFMHNSKYWVLAEGKELRLGTIIINHQDGYMQFREMLNYLDVEIEYCDIYETPFLLELSNLKK